MKHSTANFINNETLFTLTARNTCTQGTRLLSQQIRQLRTDLKNICEFQLALKSQRRCPRRCPTSIVTCCRTETIPTMSKKRCITDYWSRKPSKSVHVEKSPSTESLDQEVSPAPAPSISTHSQQKSGAERADNSSESAEILEADPYDSGASLRQFWLLQGPNFRIFPSPEMGL